MSHLAICRTCQFAFAFQVVADGGSAGLPELVFCPRCGGHASLSDGTVAGFFSLFNAAFPTATPRRLKREVWALASKIASGQINPAQALSGDYHVSDDPEERRFLWTIGVSIAALIVAVLTYLQNERVIAPGVHGDAQALVCAQILEHLHRIAHEGDETLGVEPLALLRQNQERTPETSQEKIAAAPKRRRPGRAKHRAKSKRS